MSFKQHQASPNGGRLAKEIINFCRPYQINSNISSVNAVFYVCGCIGSSPTQFLLDSGAAMSVVNYNVVKCQPIAKIHTHAVGANGAPRLDVVGQITVLLQLDDFKVDHQFTVVRNLTVDCLLGADFLQKHSTVLDCHNNTLSVGQKFQTVIPMDFIKQFSSMLDSTCITTSIVRAPCDMEIPGRRVQLIAEQLENSHGDTSVMLVEPLLHFPDHLCVERSLSSVFKSQVAIQIMNTYKNIQRNEIGYCDSREKHLPGFS